MRRSTRRPSTQRPRPCRAARRVLVDGQVRHAGGRLGLGARAFRTRPRIFHPREELDLVGVAVRAVRVALVAVQHALPEPGRRRLGRGEAGVPEVRALVGVDLAEASPRRHRVRRTGLLLLREGDDRRAGLLGRSREFSIRLALGGTRWQLSRLVVIESLALATGATMAVAYSANLFTFFVAYQALTLTAFPLVAHRGDEDARVAGRTFLATLLAASMGLFLPAMIWTYALTGALDFRPGGVLGEDVDALTANVLLVLFVLGLAMAAIPPLHRWLPVAKNAPTPALVSLQALLVLPAVAAQVITQRLAIARTKALPIPIDAKGADCAVLRPDRQALI